MNQIAGFGTSLPTVAPPALERTPNRAEAAKAIGKQFDGIFASLILKQMRQSLESGGLFGGDKSDVLGGLFDHFLGEHIAKSGGFGIGDMIRMQIERRGEATQGIPNR